MSTSHRPKPTPLQRVAIFFIAHVLISASLVAAVGSLLFYLIDIRATVLTGSDDLRRIGGWFVFATVLIVRLRHTYPHPARAVLYTAALFLASLWALTQFRSFGFDLNGYPCRDSTTLVNALVLGFTWWFATRLGRLMSIDDDMYDALIRMDSACDATEWSGDSQTEKTETLSDGQRTWVATLRRPPKWAPGEGSGFFASMLKRISQLRMKKKARDDSDGDPTKRVLALVLVSVPVFALGGIVLPGHDQALVEAAFVHTVIFIGSSGLLLALASGIGALRRVSRRKGVTNIMLLPARTLVGGSIIVIALVIGLALVGNPIASGTLNQPQVPSDLSERGDGNQDGGTDRDSTSPGERGDTGERVATDGQNGGQNGSDGESRAPGQSAEAQQTEPSQTGGGSTLLRLFSEARPWLLRILYVIIFAFVSYLFFAHRQRTLAFLKSSFGGLTAGIRTFFDSLKGIRRSRKKPAKNLFSGLEQLERLPPKKALGAAYERALMLGEAIGVGQGDFHTPFEQAQRIGKRQPDTAKDVRILAELYARVAYGSVDPSAQWTEKALGCLRRLSLWYDDWRVSQNKKGV